jgi:GSH-dependent disulfide-bond oxidoreductase
MIDLHYWPTPNGWKASIMLEETALPYRLVPVNIGRGEQFRPEFLAISPNNRMPAIVDHDPSDHDGGLTPGKPGSAPHAPRGGAPVTVFESGAILMYLAEKTGKFMPSDLRGRYEVIQWVMWQMGGLGPMAGQASHFRAYAPEKIEYAIDRYTKEVNRLFGVMNKRLADREYLAGDYSIADMMSWPWVVPWERMAQKLSDFPHLERWFKAVEARPAVKRGFEVGKELRNTAPMDEEAKKVLFGQTAATAEQHQAK